MFEQQRKFALRRENCLVFIVDVQGRLVPSMSNGPEIEKNTNVFLEAANAYELPAVYSEQYPKGLGATTESVLEKLTKCDAYRIEKTIYSAVTETSVIEQLASYGRKQIILTGLETHVCVYQTVRDLIAHGYTVFIPEDAVGSRTEANRRSGLSLMKDMGAVITNTESLLFDLIHDAKDPHFKRLQALIK